VVGLGLTRDPYMMVGLDNMWVNAGNTQFHLPSRAKAQCLRGEIDLVVPSLDGLRASLATVLEPLSQTRFEVHDHGDGLELRCPWGNRLHVHANVHAAADDDAVRLGIVALRFPVPRATVPGIGRFYAERLGARVWPGRSPEGDATMSVQVGPGQQLVFVASDAPIEPYDGHHIQIYLHDAEGPCARLADLGLVTRMTSAEDWRFVHIVDPQTGETLFELEHEIRSTRHPLYRRPLVNRNPAQGLTPYRPGADALVLSSPPAGQLTSS
jgi:hypothetical protein